MQLKMLLNILCGPHVLIATSTPGWQAPRMMREPVVEKIEKMEKMEKMDTTQGS